MKTTLALVMAAALIVIAGCTTTKLVETPPGSGNFQKVEEIDPRFTKTIETIGAVNDATSGVNPAHGLITILLGASTAVASWVAKKKNDQIKTLTGK